MGHVLAPFGHIPVDLVEAPGVRLQTADRDGRPAPIALGACTFIGLPGWVVIGLSRRDRCSPPERRPGAGTSDVLTFRFGEKPVRLAGGPALFPDDCIQLQPRLRAHCHVCRAPHIGAVYREASHSSDAAATCAYQRTPAEIRSRSTPTRYEAVCDPGLHRRSSQYDDNDRDHDHSDRYAHTRAQAEIV